MTNLYRRAAAILPGEGQLSLAHIKLVGNTLLEVENHQGVIAYSAQQVQLSLKESILVVTGEDLEIQRLDREVIHLNGRIDNLRFGQ
jgi:sporulation protein YqfC